MRIRLLRDRMFSPHWRVRVDYREGMELTVKREWGEALVADGSAEELDVPATAREIAMAQDEEG
jgi:hypothetical protein